MIKNKLGARYTKFVNYEFKDVEGKTVCVVDVKFSSKPVFLKWENKMEFHVRVGNTTNELDTQEATEYIKMNWE